MKTLSRHRRAPRAPRHDIAGDAVGHSAVAPAARRLRQQIEHLWSSFHCMDDEFVPTVEDENDGLEETPLRVEAEAKLSSRRVVIEILDPHRGTRHLSGVLSGDAVLQR